MMPVTAHFLLAVLLLALLAWPSCAQLYLSTVQVDSMGNIVMNTAAGQSCLCNGNDLVALIASLTAQATALSALVNAPCLAFEYQVSPATTSTKRVCVPIYWGTNFNIDAAYLSVSNVTMSGITSVPGYLLLGSNPFIMTLSLPALTLVALYVDINNNAALTTVNVPSLAYIGSYFSISNNNNLLVSLTASALTFVGGDLSVAYAGAITLVSLPQLVRVSGSLTVNQAGSLTYAAFPLLTYVANNLMVCHLKMHALDPIRSSVRVNQ